MTRTHPACCGPFDFAWPLPAPLPGVRWVACRFDPARLDPAAFRQSDVPMPASIERSVPKRQAEYLAGRLCAREALLPLLGRPAIPTIGNDRAPVWPHGVCGSITHGSGLAAAVVGPSRAWRSLGLDVEEDLPDDRAERLAGEILVPAELERLAGLPAAERARQVTLTFSLKESLFKALYPLVRQRFYFEAAEVVACAGGRARLRLLADLDGEWRAGCELDGLYAAHGAHLLSVVAVAARG
ncbi:4'-phosphopantetheinyl transferase family protein [Pseudomonas mangiferae]|uniref:Enterobactin synthase component D n=1 Tax=Pseudomonas mangiferae TaxID=2593654 RepID=A0A553H2M7_9PSED|nr:4'-phosphopantetheinyl transferase superfamily protein [Pseudomonas mangiferae]TRX76004.1 4'-phosphopantetheinyl transferase superfamily protein [Pseudomonas mangiferae]